MFGGFWDTTGIINGDTVNFIKTPSVGAVPFTALLIGGAFLLFILILIFRKNVSRDTVIGAGIVSLLTAWTVFAFRMDYNWLTVFKGDLSGRGAEERNGSLRKNDFRDFIYFVRDSVPEGGRIMDLQDPVMEKRIISNDPGVEPKYQARFNRLKLGQYYLLPLFTYREGEYIWVYNDPEASYDPETRVLRAYDSEFIAVPHAVYSPGAAVFKIEGKR